MNIRLTIINIASPLYFVRSGLVQLSYGFIRFNGQYGYLASNSVLDSDDMMLMSSFAILEVTPQDSGKRSYAFPIR